MSMQDMASKTPPPEVYIYVPSEQLCFVGTVMEYVTYYANNN